MGDLYFLSAAYLYQTNFTIKQHLSYHIQKGDLE